MISSEENHLDNTTPDDLPVEGLKVTDDDHNTNTTTKPAVDLSYDEVYPCLARNEFKFGKLVFSSKFDSGNMLKVSQVSRWEYEVETALDCEGTSSQTTYSSWFHFSVFGATEGDEITIRMTNLNKHPGLYDNDMRPVFRTSHRHRKWERVKSVVSHRVVEKRRSVITFKHRFKSATHKVYFAFCYPYSYTELQRKLTDMEKKFSTSDEIYFHREVLTKSLDSRRVELLTISSYDGISSDEREEVFDPNLFPSSRRRPLRFQNKRVIFISARIHPGETPASHVLDGILEFITRLDDPRSALLRQEFVFKIIPMLNPDGVARGHYRTDTNGLNLNRVYQNPSFELHPSVYAAKQTVLYLHKKRRQLVMYLDLHAHASKRGCFIYGNNLPEVSQQVLTQLYPALVGLSSSYFEYDQCNFTEKNMKSKDARDATGATKEGSGRVALYRETNLVHVYTIECNYNMGRHACGTPNAAGGNGNVSPGVTKRTFVPKYTAENWQDVGKGLAIGILDLYEINPFTRVSQSAWRSHEGLRKDIEASVLKDREVKTQAGLSKSVKGVVQSIRERAS